MRKIGNKTTEKLLGILELQATFLITMLIMLIVVNFIAFPIQVEGDSMYPSLNDRELGLSNIWSLKHTDLERFDVVIVKVNDEYWVKRVMALPNETIYCKDNEVYVNNQKIEQDFLDASYVEKEIKEHGYFTQDFDEITLKDDEVYLMGDNRIHSLDSRIVGPFQLSQLIAKNVYIIWPFGDGKVVE